MTLSHEWTEDQAHPPVLQVACVWLDIALFGYWRSVMRQMNHLHEAVVCSYMSQQNHSFAA
ncbi:MULTISPECIES: hypothetical protein [Vitreoscilla]|uniref:Uncharacterized protein n=1 Tax=Vitreoscilla stercoraria TaxID=61 RepID=A0ABY4E9Y5_VITST|nr:MULTISPECIES: hypothetical protein [Vitreoscilla]AUZ04553.1 hypothetical protein ADP71_08040 [Vitreoscilla sp. C1]UOO91740.1 hypothetical protein LVJ81_08855 [Vitreoscilla stercoraria]